ncbi:helix-turn-helix domain-containing protein [Veillonella sp.]|jgi:excisionase family DNA binding protein|uniref:helix-turn-helix domain-containing protein n=1 Tax=Veillonella sp. TaxID=1926307 RepID=UPI00204FA1A7|nr:helix-turn-helix domain-containing protein [Veillonella sp.]MBS6486387.1 helix-turn-helix domain-containing protein [Veillonella sp.]DAL52949.1 MAG TPA_asm: helix-turn-helix domain protein [Caudoviricetes sp.]
MEDILFTAKETAKLLKTDEPTVRRLINKGFLKALKLGRLKIRKVEIDRFLAWAEGKDLTDLDNVIDLDYEGSEKLACAQ